MAERKRKPRPAKPPFTPDATLDPRSDAARVLVGETMTPVRDLGVNDMLGALDAARRKEQEKQYKRYAAAAEIAKYRWMIATEAHLLEDGIRQLNFESHRFQKQIYQDAALDLIIFGSAQWGKAQPLDSLVHTPAGWARMGDLRAGDVVSTPDGGSANVVGVFPQGTLPIYRVRFADGRSAEACGEHLWECHWSRHRPKPSRPDHHEKPACAEVLTTTQIATRLADGGGRVYVPLAKPVEKPEQPLPLDPYLMGLLLGDGELGERNLRFATADPEVVDACNAALAPIGCELHLYESSRPYTYNIRSVAATGTVGRLPGGAYSVHPLKRILRDLELLGTGSLTKFVPHAYKEGSVAQRLALLQGLMDSDGYASRSISFATVSRRLADDVREVVRSLGGIASMSEKRPTYEYNGERRNGHVCYKVNVRHTCPRSLFRLDRKRARATERYQFADSLKLELTSIELVGERPARCIKIDHPRSLYITDDYVVTHNTEFIICDMAASAAFGLKMMVVCSKKEKREKFVASRVNPCFQQVQFYKQMIELAAQRGATADSTTFKHFGYGWINLINGEVAKDFTSHPTDKVTTDEHQECNKNNLDLIPDRLSGSPFNLQVRVGHPTTEGTEENNNLDWLYKTSNQNEYRVPCPTCRREQKLTWWDHVVYERRNKGGGIVELRPRDPEWKPGGRWDMRPVCLECHRPMDRLHEGGLWHELRPGVERHGYKLSNLYNPNTRLDGMFDRYSRSRFKPRQMGEFVNKQLGEPWSMDGSKVNDAILAACASGEGTGIAPYRFVSAQTFDWRNLESFGAAA